MRRFFLKIEKMVSFCESLAELSTCKRVRQAAVVFPIDCSAVYAIGYNGPPRLTSNESCRGLPGACGCAHAEANAIVKLNQQVTKSCIIECTTQPCEQCANLILNTEVVRAVLYTCDYRDPTGIEKLSACMPVQKWSKDMTEDTYAKVCQWRYLGLYGK